MVDKWTTKKILDSASNIYIERTHVLPTYTQNTLTCNARLFPQYFLYC